MTFQMYLTSSNFISMLMQASPYHARDRARAHPQAPRNVDGSDIPSAWN